MLDRLDLGRWGERFKRLPWPGHRGALGAEAQSPVVRAALAAAVGYGFLLMFPLLLYRILVHGNLYQQAVTATTVGDVGRIVLWFGVAGLCAAVSYALIRFRAALSDGYMLNRAHTPELFRLIDEVRGEFPSALRRRPVTIDRLCIAEGARVEMVRTPRLGFPFTFSNTLVIGLEAAQTLSASQFKVAVARSVGQLRGRGHGLNAWLFHLRRTWACYLRLETLQPAPVRWLLEPFFGWYVPWYERMSAAAAEQFAHTGDTYALEIVDHETVSDGIVALAVNARFLEQKFWPAVERLQGKLLQPTHYPYASLEQAFLKGIQPGERARWLREAVRGNDRTDAAQPPLRERIADLSWPEDRLPQVPEQTAARRYLTNAYDDIVRALDHAWWQDNKPQWRQRFKRFQKTRPRLAALRRKLASHALDDGELRTLIKLAGMHLRGTDAVAVYQDVLKQRPDDARLHFALGSRLLRYDEAVGVAALERAMALDERYVIRACKLISQRRGARKTAVRAA